MTRQRYLTWPNRMTMLRIILIAPFVICLLNLRQPTWQPWARYLAVSLFALMIISDGLDGYLARRFQQETPIGRFLDPLADKLLITCAVVLLGIEATTVSGFQIPSWVVVIAIGKDLFVVVGFLLVFIVTGRIFIEPGWSGKLCTQSQMALVVTVLIGPDLAAAGDAAPMVVKMLLRTFWLTSSVLAFLTCWLYYRKGARFAHNLEHEQTTSGR